MANTCAWCHKPTILPEVFAADVPILDWMEERITNYCIENNIPVKIVKVDYSVIARAIAMRQIQGFFKIIVTNDAEMKIL